MTDALIVVVLLGLCNGALSQVVTWGAIFAPVRTAIQERSEFFGDLIDCSLCFGLWSAALISALAVWRLFDGSDGDAVLLWAAGAFSIHGVGLVSGHAYRALVALHD